MPGNSQAALIIFGAGFEVKQEPAESRLAAGEAANFTEALPFDLLIK